MAAGSVALKAKRRRHGCVVVEVGEITNQNNKENLVGLEPKSRRFSLLFGFVIFL